MPLYSYKAVDSSGKVIQDVLDATDEMAAVATIQEKGYVPIRVTMGGGGKRLLSSDLTAPLKAILKRVSGKDIMMFTQDLATLLEAGLPIDRSLSILGNVSEKEQLQALVRDILRIVQGGGSLSDALAKYPKAFSKFYINMVRAGEAGGILESVLQRLGIFLESSQDLKDYIKSALVYPIFLLLVGGASIIILMTYVIPRFSIIFEDLGSTIPLSTQILLASSNMLRSYWWAFFLIFVVGYFAANRYKKSPYGRNSLDKIKLRIPVAKDFIQKLEVSRFTRTLGTLIQSGVPILKSLNLVKGIIGNKVIADALTEVHERVKEGERLSIPLEDSGVFPPLAIQMITVGEETGKLEEMLLRVADNYEKIIKNMVKRLIGFLEPAMILIMGFVVAFIVISMLMAIFSMNEIPF